MINVICDSCDVKRKAGEEWVLGYDIESVSPNGVRRAITFLDRWDPRRMDELGAIHFCSLECKSDYLKKQRAA
ncbi:MAG: hypothetical protein NVS9B15_13410 [Acidobacteriaceae bacterium]